MKAPKFITPHSAFRIPRSESGFTLVEIAMVLVLLGVLVTFGMTLVGPLTKKLKYNATKEIIQAAIDGIEGWSYAGGPSGEKILPPSGTGTNTFGGIVRNTNDAWLAKLYYVYDNNLTATSTGGICGKQSTSICLNSACPGTYVAFAVLSAADDHTVQTTLNGSIITAYGDGTAGSGAGTGALVTPSTSDDIVYYVTLNELRTKAGCKGAQLQILNQELPAGINSQAYSANIYVDPAYAGVTPYAWSVSGQTAATFGCGAGNYPPSGYFCCGGTGTCTGTCTGICVSGICTGGAGTCTGTCVTGGAGVAGQCTYSTGICLNGNGTTGVLSSGGLPIVAEACSLPFTVNVTDSNSNSAAKTFLLDIK